MYFVHGVLDNHVADGFLGDLERLQDGHARVDERTKRARETRDDSGPTAGWPEYGGDKGGLRYSPLTQIDASNVGDLEIAWIHHNGDISDGNN